MRRHQPTREHRASIEQGAKEKCASESGTLDARKETFEASQAPPIPESKVAADNREHAAREDF